MSDDLYIVFSCTVLLWVSKKCKLIFEVMPDRGYPVAIVCNEQAYADGEILWLMFL